MKKVHRMIEFNQYGWLKPYIDMNTDLRKKAKNDFEKDFMNNAVFWKIMRGIRKHWDIKLVTIERGRIYLASEPIYDATKFLTENLLAIEIKKSRDTYE